MPIMTCQKDNKNGYKYGETGTCYTYTEGNNISKILAKEKAAAQGRAIETSKNKKS